MRLATRSTWLLLAILTPLCVNFWGQQPFELPKVALVRTLVWLLAGLALAKHALSPRSLRRTLRANPLLGPLGLLALVVAVTTITAADWRLSLWGSYERAQGAVTLLTYLLLCVLAAHSMRSGTRARELITALVVASIPLILLGLLQAIGRDPFGLVTDARSPVYATLGRANFVGAYLAMLSPLTLALLLSTRRRRRRVVWSAVLVGQVITIGLTLSRSAWLATAASLSLFSLLWWGPRLARRWRALAWSGMGLLFLSGPLAVVGLGQGQSGSGAARLAIWRATLELVGRRPLLGYGADALGVVFPRVYPPQLVYYQGRELFVDRAHNLLLDWTVMAGIPGLLAWSLVLVTFVIVAVRALRRPLSREKRALLAAVVCAVLGNVANNLVSFDVTSTATTTWLLMGLGVALAAPPAYDDVATPPRRRFYHWGLAALPLVGIGIAVWQMNARPLIADVAARSASRYAQQGAGANALAASGQAVAQWPVEPAHHLLLSGSYWNQAVADPASARNRMPQAEAALLAARRLRPGDPAVWLYTAQFYASVEQRFGGATRGLAEEAFGRALELAPNYATIHVAWGRFYLQDDNPQAAAPLLRQAVVLDGSNGAAYVYLGDAELALGRVQVALADYREAVRLLPASAQAYAGMAACYLRLDQPQQALTAAEEALRRDPHSGRALAVRQEIDRAP